MGVSIIADDRGAILYCNTADEPFGKVMTHPSGCEYAHRDIADEVLNRCPRDPRNMDEEAVNEIYFEVKEEKVNEYKEVWSSD